MHLPRPLQPHADLRRHRASIARVLLMGFAVLGLVAYVPSVLLAVKVGAWGVAVLDTVVYAAILAVLARGGQSYRLEAGVVVGACYVLGVGLAVILGPHGAGPLWLMAASIAAAILFDRRGAIAVLVLVTLTIIAVSVLGALALMPWSYRGVTMPLLWMVLASNALLLAAAASLAVIKLIRGLHQEMSERHKAESQLRQAEKLQAIGTLAAGIAHDFNNLLTPILSATELARDDTAADSAARAALDQAVDAAVAGRDLVRRILAFSRPSCDGRVTMAAGLAFGDAVQLLRASVPGSVEVAIDTAGDDLISLSPTEVQQIVLNLGTNAHKAMPDGGLLKFRLDTLPGDAVAGTNPTPRPARIVRLEVTDTGCGMAPDVAERVFEPFFTTDAARGTGIGLATVHGIVASAGGTITCTSHPGVGTTFCIDLPAVERPAATDTLAAAVAAPAAPAAAAADLARSGRRVLVVDDERAVRDVAAHVLRRRGYRVTSLGSGAAALKLLAIADHGIEVVLTDLHMPGMSGLEFARRIQSEHPGIALVVMSGLVDEARALADAIGIDSVIGKPFRLAELTTAIDAAIHGQYVR